MKDKEFRALMDLVMCCDPWPVEDDEGGQRIIISMLDEESELRGYDGWIEAYHEFESPDD